MGVNARAGRERSDTGLGGRIARVAALALGGLVSSAAASPDVLVARMPGGAEVDWRAGTISARAGAAADIRLPSPDVARPGAERLARAAALKKLHGALVRLPLRRGRHLPEAVVEAALGRARAVATDYQSNGGVMVTLALRFSDLFEANAEPALTLVVPAAPLALAPILAAGTKEAPLGWAIYRMDEPPAGSAARAVRRDRKGRLRLVDDAGASVEKLAGAGAVIYLGKVLR